MAPPTTAGDAAELRTRVLAYLGAHNVMTLATTEPWAAAVFYVNDGFELCFLSSPRSRHCTHLATDPRASVTIQEDYAQWRDIKGVQLEGVVEQVRADDEARIRALYGAKFPVVAEHAGAGSAIARALARVRWYRVVPSALHFVDNAAGFGQRSAVDLRPPPAPPGA